MGSSLFQTTSKIVALSRSGQITLARKLFDEMPHRDSIAWNAMLTSYSQLGLSLEALTLFSDMKVSGIPLDDFSFTAALSSSSDAGELHLGRKIHGLVISSGYHSSLPVCNSLLDMYGKCLVPCSAERVFEEMSVKNNVSWCSLLFAYVKTGDFENGYRVFVNMPDRVVIACNILMAGYARLGKFELCVDLFRKMRGTTCEPDLWTFTALMNACAELSETHYGRMIHGCIVKSSWSCAVELNNSILSFYAKQSCCQDAVKIFKSIKTLTQVSWNAMIDAHMKIGEDDKALDLFQRSPEKNLVSWTSMITGYARNGQGEQALSFFIDMIRNFHRPDDFTFGAVLHACSSLAIQGHGRMIHGCVIHYGFHSYAYVGNSLVNMYAKCGDIEGSCRAFTDIREKDLVSWNAMLFGFGLHGRAMEALKLYEEMITSKVNPDKVTFIGLLMTCSHSGLIERGKVIFESMGSVYRLPPEADHVACMVDMLGRGGYFKQAKELVEEYSRKLSISSPETLFGAFASSLHGEVDLDVSIGEDLMNMDPRNDMGYVLLSNLYCANGQWKEAEKVRKSMMEQGVKKTPGCSWIEVRDKVMVFVAGNHTHPHMKEMYEILNFLEPEMRNPTYFGFENYKAFHAIMMKNSLCSFVRNQIELNAIKLIYIGNLMQHKCITDKTKTQIKPGRDYMLVYSRNETQNPKSNSKPFVYGDFLDTQHSHRIVVKDFG